MKHQIKIAIRAFFLASDQEYRSYDLRRDVVPEDLERFFAKGKASLHKRSYVVPSAVAKKIDSYSMEKIDWDFSRYYYQIGAFCENEVVPDGFVLRQRSLVDGSVAALFAPAVPFNPEVFLPYVDKNYLGRYETVFLGVKLAEGLSRLFVGSENLPESGFFYELSPVLRAHANFYAEHHGLNLLSPESE